MCDKNLNLKGDFAKTGFHWIWSWDNDFIFKAYKEVMKKAKNEKAFFLFTVLEIFLSNILGHYCIFLGRPFLDFASYIVCFRIYPWKLETVTFWH